MPRNCLSAAALALLTLAGCQGAAVQVTVVLQAAPDASLNGLSDLKVIVRELSSETPEIFGPFPIDRSQQETLGAAVQPNSDFYIDVWGCPSGSECLPTDVVARGCSPVTRFSEAESPAVVAITLYDPLQEEAALCPPPLVEN